MGSGYFGFQGNSRVGDDQRILGGLKVRFQEFCGETKFGRYSFGWLHLTRDFLGIQNNLKIPGSALVSSPGSSANKVQLTFFSAVKIFKARKIGRGIV